MTKTEIKSKAHNTTKLLKLNVKYNIHNIIFINYIKITQGQTTSSRCTLSLMNSVSHKYVIQDVVGKQ